jgi:hypothetical protein
LRYRASGVSVAASFRQANPNRLLQIGGGTFASEQLA